jgi:hypothetical protein
MDTRLSPLHGHLLDGQLNRIGTIAKMVLIGRVYRRSVNLRGLAEVQAPCLACPGAFWIRVTDVGMLRIRVTRMDPSRAKKLLIHFKVLASLQATRRRLSGRVAGFAPTGPQRS